MINLAELTRLEKSEDGTFGVLKLDGKVFCVTLEPPDKGNAPDISCIPEGVYLCKKVNSPHFGPTYEIANVPGRTNILFHPGNIKRDTHGCILLGRHYGPCNGGRGVITSGATCRDFLAIAASVDEFELRVTKATREA
ncbi:MAG: hypothetical protein JEY79_11110 [Pseudodesulfovibrio sp.]|nr:hypothetical protein [Pseudodesulfovibrio sp.]